MKSPFDLTNKRAVIEFKETDPYNPQNILEGYINRRQGNLYGALWITHVNGKKCEQLIYSAPKQHYPFGKDKNGEIIEWEFPEYEYFYTFEKLDGTCIISFIYKDSDGKEYLTYKTRLRPFLGESKYGNFFQLWNEMREKYQIDDYCRDSCDCCVFELYGKRNKILIDYDIPLDTKLIFIVDSLIGEIFLPVNPFGDYNINVLYPETGIRGITEFIDEELYGIIQNELEDELFIDEESKIMKGKEGYVLYFMKHGVTKQIKCKPPSVLKYHWAGDAIAYESVYTTVVNAFENFDEPTYDDVVGLLQEEFDVEKIEKSRVRIEKVLGKVLFDKKLQYELADDYRKLGVDINLDKVTVMRHFGKIYPKSEAHRIFNLLKQYEDGK